MAIKVLNTSSTRGDALDKTKTMKYGIKTNVKGGTSKKSSK